MINLKTIGTGILRAKIVLQMDVNDGIKVFAFGMAILLTVILNGVILVTILIEKRPRFSTRCIHVLVTNLAVCQFLIGMLVMPFVEVSVLHDSWKNSTALCQFNGFTTSTCFYTAVLTLCTISLDRFVAIVLATRYQKLLTKKRGCIIVCLIWTTSSLLSTPPLIGWSTYQYHPGTLHCSPLWIGQCGYFYFTFTISVIIPTSLTVLSYIIIFWKVRKHRKRVAMWQNARGRGLSSKSEGAESDIEMSQAVTIHKSPAVARRNGSVMHSRSELHTNSPTTSHKSLSPTTGLRVYKPRSNSQKKGSFQEGSLAPNGFLRKGKFIEFHGEGIFYNPKKHEPSKLAQNLGEPVVVKEFENVEDKADGTKSEVVQSRGEDNNKEITATEPVTTNSSKNVVTNVTENRGESDRNTKKRVHKANLGRLVKISRTQMTDNSKMSEEDANGLLNLSEDNGGSSVPKSESSTQNTEASNLNNDLGATNAEGDMDNNAPKGGNKISTIAMALITSMTSKSSETIKSKRGSRRKTKHVNRTLREFQVAKTGAILLSVFMVCYGPYTVVHLCHLPFPVPIWAQHFAMWCVFLNSILTPLVYGLMNKDTRQKIKAAMKRCWR
ncbi:uncharacterized protein LOC135681347 [Rhopilema esculentum]|uniref:uncharacterized protein LOC135681347 n=1 Tax=Rhopilema esculentum TaxID=499914 RepID=UPI0031DE5CC2